MFFFLLLQTILMDKDYHAHSKHRISNWLLLLIYFRICLFQQYGFQYTFQITIIHYWFLYTLHYVRGETGVLINLYGPVGSVQFYPHSRLRKTVKCYRKRGFNNYLISLKNCICPGITMKQIWCILLMIYLKTIVYLVLYSKTWYDVTK